MKRFASLTRRCRFVGPLWLLASVVACTSSKEPLRDQRDFGDAAGRTCRATLTKASASAQAVSESVECNDAGKQCSSESRSCFELSIAAQADNYEVRNCPACCLGTASSFFAADCSALVCTTAADCVFARAECIGGVCTCPTGSCG